MSDAAAPGPEEPASPDDAACGLLRTDGQGLILAANATFCGWVGRSKADLLRQRKFQELLAVGSRIFHQTHWAPLLQMQGSVSEVKLELKCADGSALPMVLNAVRREREGRVLHDLALFVARDRDIYERELLASREELRQLVQEATRLQEEAKDRALFAEQMVGIVSHDLRNPLSAIQMGVLALSRGEPTSNQVRILGRVSRSADRANRLIADLLDFTAARIGKGLGVSPRALDLHAAVAESLEELAAAYPERRLEHVCEGAGTVLAEPDRLAQLLGNLVSNAVAYGDPARPVTVTSRVGEGGGALEVHNFGPVIPPEAIATLFQPMVRGDATGAARSVGLGLYIVGEIAKAHGGGLAVRSDAQAGTAFEATFAPAGPGRPA